MGFYSVLETVGVSTTHRRVVYLGRIQTAQRVLRLLCGEDTEKCKHLKK